MSIREGLGEDIVTQPLHPLPPSRTILEAGRYIVTPIQRVFYSVSGSSILVFLHDPTKKVSGLVHAQLPDSAEATSNIFNVGKYVDTAIIATLNDMVRHGAVEGEIVAKVIGGAKKLKCSDVGLRNAGAVKDILRRLGIKIIAEDTDGEHGRHVEVHTKTGQVIARIIIGKEALVKYL
jgi:chemotaxis protein CheD